MTFWLEVISYILLVDSILALLVAWYGQGWYVRNVGLLARYLPPAKGWALWYVTLAIFIFWLIHGGVM